jgi:hypothetical protein
MVFCVGTGCNVCFNNVQFVRCTLVVLSGAHVNLQNCEFEQNFDSTQGLSLLAHGEQTTVEMAGGRIRGGAVGVVVQAGAAFTMSDATVCKVSVSGVECYGDKCTVNISSVTFENFSECCSCSTYTHAVHVHDRSSMHVQGVTIKGQSIDYGIFAHNYATLYMNNCTVTEINLCGVRITSGSTGTLDGCVISESQGTGLHVIGCDSSCVATSCILEGNRSAGAGASKQGKLKVMSCESKRNMGLGGYAAQDGGAITVERSSSRGDVVGCRAFGASSHLKAHFCTVSQSSEKSVVVDAGAVAELDSCQIERAGHEGVFAAGTGTQASLQGCTVTDTRYSCIFVRNGAHAVAQWCTLAGSKIGNGVDIYDADTEMRVEGCLVKNNNQNGVHVANSTRKRAIVVTRCRSFGNGGLAYHSSDGSEFTLEDVSEK